MEVTKSLMELMDESPVIDNTAVYPRLWGIVGELRAKLEARFELRRDPSTAALAEYGAPGVADGSLNTFTGPEIDWLVHSWIGNPKTGFCNMHLTTWLKPHTRVPHLGLAMGTIPDVFFYMDYIPRADVWTDLTYHDKYYEPVNARYIALHSDSRFTPFTSKTLYMRTGQSVTSLCFTCKPTEETLGVIRDAAHEMLDRWLTWVDAGEAVPETDQLALAERDLFIRRAIAERDPANAMGVRLFGAAMTEKLVRGLWGGDRSETVI